MGLVNIHLFSRTVIEADKFLEATHNQYKVVSVREFIDKKGILPKGFNLTLMVIKDDFKYGVDKNGVERENNLYRNFEVTVLNQNTPIKKGDIVRLLDFDEEHSYVIKFDVLFRFRNYEVIAPQNKVQS